MLSDVEQPAAILIGTGSEVHIALAAQQMLQKEQIAVRVVSMPSWELFDAQPAGYRDSVLPPDISARVAVEAAGKLGWERYVGMNGAIVGLERYGASAPYQEIYEHLGITAKAVVQAAKELLS